MAHSVYTRGDQKVRSPINFWSWFAKINFGKTQSKVGRATNFLIAPRIFTLLDKNLLVAI